MSSLTMYFMTKLAIRLSNKISFYDFPKDRNLHKKPIPILGGFALLVSILVNVFMHTQWEWRPFTAGCVGAVLIFLIGLYDDKYALRPWVKIFLQSIVIAFLYYHHIRIEFITWPSLSQPIFFAPSVSFLITQLWMIVIINMFNIIDGIDGLAVGISCLTSIILFFVSLSVSPLIISYLLCSIIGSTGMFLKFNFHPAKIFLGDSGALLLGYLFAICSILGVLKSTISFSILLFVFAIPIMDLVLSVIRRGIKGKNIFYPDLEHIHHQLVRRGLSVRKTAIILYIVSGVFGLIGVFSALNSTPLKLIGGAVLFFGVLLYFSILQMSNKRFKSIK
jgi:UDP-GlcNAc:undecaprenyl-phosphate GlcNAc-1-phosphate transferase